MAGYVHGSMMSNGLDTMDNVVYKPWLISDRGHGNEPAWHNRSAGYKTTLPGSCGDGMCCNCMGAGGGAKGGWGGNMGLAAANIGYGRTPIPPPGPNPRAHDFTHDVPYGYGAPSPVGHQTPSTRAVPRRIDTFGGRGPIVNPGVSNPNSVSWDPSRRQELFQSSV